MWFAGEEQAANTAADLSEHLSIGMAAFTEGCIRTAMVPSLSHRITPRLPASKLRQMVETARLCIEGRRQRGDVRIERMSR